MFGVDFSELMVIAVVALIVVGPERLPKVARTLGFLWGQAQRYVNGVKADIASDMATEEYRQLTQKIQQVELSAEQAVTEVTRTIDQHVQQLNDTVAQPAQAIFQAATTVPQSALAIQQKIQLELQTTAEKHKFPVD